MDNTSHVLDEIDHAVSELKVQKWTATLPFNGCLCLSTDDVVMVSFQDCHDLFSLTSTLHKGFILRFDPQMFPIVPGGVAKNKDSNKKLFDVLISIDKTRRQKQWQENCANRRWSVTERIPEVPKASLSQRRTSTSKATTVEDTCKVKVAFDADSVSLFLVCEIRESQLEGHYPRNAVDMAKRKRIVPAAATDFQQMSANHNIGPGKTSAMVEEEFGLHLLRHQVAQMQQLAKLADDLTSTDELEEYKHLDSDTDRVLAYLKKKGATYCALYHGICSSSAKLVPQTLKKTKTDVGARDVAHSGQLIWTERMEYTLSMWKMQ
ncbi:hypothetical protein IV203_034051 [Nitzschia inconspicua]|uniref:Uncharacterized protein n=1 Tax=Nitzschia inconspicua TaxID=303405 RepID=A0A9K3M3U8_9STRA|nr:hypothetical protein IV203_034051 [Nitzschia inconspicua]